MASIANRPRGHKWIQFTYQGKRPTLRLGKASKRVAEEVKRHVEFLIAAKISNTAMPIETANWLSGLSDELRNKIAKLGLIVVTESVSTKTLAELFEHCREQLKDLAVNTRKSHEQTYWSLTSFFGADRDINSITLGDSDEYVSWLKKQGGRRNPNKPPAQSTAARRVSHARQFFQIAVRKKWIPENPFADQSVPEVVDAERQAFVTRATIDKILEQMPDNQWKLILVLSRYQGLRCPSEILSLRWEWVDWHARRMKVFSPKNQRYVSKKWRIMPIFPETMPYLEKQFEEAKPGSELIIDYPGRTEAAISSKLQWYRGKACVEPWPKLTQNLRASLETELVERFPIHVVTYWLGNSPKIAQKHYLQVTDEHYATATGGGEVKSEVTTGYKESQGVIKNG